MIREQYGYNIDKHSLDYIFVQNKEDRLYVVSRDIGNIDFEKLRIDNTGIYFGEIYKDKLRLSIEGAQIIGEKATRNVVELNHYQMIEWVKGSDIDFEDCGKDFVIVRYKEPKTEKYDILGCGKYNSTNNKLMNYVSKSRKLVVVNE
jgi:NOL1/NOP2/fmu family ribosome biogenesis protein